MKIDIDTKMKGDVTYVNRLGHVVKLWVSSPTGDASDSHVFELECHSIGQAKLVASKWRKVWGLNLVDEVSEDNS
jgi:hypothetical protein